MILKTYITYVSGTYGTCSSAERGSYYFLYLDIERDKLFKDRKVYCRKDIFKNPIPEGLGEAPGYDVEQLSRGHRRRGRHNNSRSAGGENSGETDFFTGKHLRKTGTKEKNCKL